MRALGFVTSSLDVSKRRNKDHSRDTKIGIMLTSSAAPTRTARKLRCGTPRNRSPPSSLQWACPRCSDEDGVTERSMDANDKYACAELIQGWGLYRDQGKWPQLLATFVPEGEIAVSWFSGSFREFVAHCRQSFEAGQRSKHQIFPSCVRIAP